MFYSKYKILLYHNIDNDIYIYGTMILSVQKSKKIFKLKRNI